MGNLPGCCSKIVQAIIIIGLCIVFLQFFGLSTLAKWERRDVQIVRRKEARESLPPPAVTICAVLCCAGRGPGQMSRSRRRGGLCQ